MFSAAFSRFSEIVSLSKKWKKIFNNVFFTGGFNQIIHVPKNYTCLSELAETLRMLLAA